MVMDAAEVIERLEEAGRTILSLPHPDRVRHWKLGLPPADPVERIMVRPTAAAISRMDEALAWLSLIPDATIVVRRIVGARSLVNPLTGRHVMSWRRIGKSIGADHKAVQRWHAQGIDAIVSALRVGVAA